jgi:hypothetical protein
MRKARFQAPRCKACGEPVFVLPASPLPPTVEPSADRKSRPAPAARLPRRGKSRPVSWVVPALLALTLAFVAATVFVLTRYGDSGAVSQTAVNLPAELDAHRQAGIQALGDGHFQVALDELKAAKEISDRHLEFLPARERRELAQLLLQADLLSDLLSESLREILVRAAGLDDREWEAVFNRRYRDKAVVFEADVRLDASRRYHLDYALHLDREPGRIELGDLKLLASLPLHTPQHLLFGGRLASIRREPPGPTWVVRFQPDQGVLLTDPGAARACGLPVEEPEIRKTLEKQAVWVQSTDGI